MIRFVERLLIDLERNLKNGPVALRIYTFVFGVTFVAFFIYGILPLSYTIKNKLDLLNEMNTDYKQLQTNLQKMQEAESVIAQNEVYINYLDKYMPIEMSIQNYMVEFIQSVGDSGFIVKNFAQESGSTAEGKINLRLDLEGNAYPQDLIKQIETLKRVTQVRGISLYQNNNNEVFINLDLTIYTLVQ